MSAETAVQTAIFDALKASAPLTAAIVDVYDDVPQLDERELADADFPFVTIGEDDVDEDDTDTSVGYSLLCEVHVWSRYAGRKEAKDIQGLIHDALHRATLTVAGFTFVDSFFDESRTLRDPDGKTYHGISIFRVTITE